MSIPRVVLLTGDGTRHRYAAQELARSVSLLGIVTETKRPVVPADDPLPTEDEAAISKHLEARTETETRILGSPDPGPIEMLAVETGGINSTDVFDWVSQKEPDAVVIYGTSIVKPPLLEVYSEKLINVHLGLSPYYRGAGTNFWPLVDGLPECVGATIHLAVLEVDAGPILGQVRPDAAPDDGAHDLGTKTIAAAFYALPELVTGYLSGRIEPRKQNLSSGKVFRRKDFSAEAVRTMWHNFETGMMADYCAARIERVSRYPIVEVPGR